MHGIRAALYQLLSWLAEPEYRPGKDLSLRDWADLPTHHPCT